MQDLVPYCTNRFSSAGSGVSKPTLAANRVRYHARAGKDGSSFDDSPARSERDREIE